jgi:hypothetical protein
VVFRNSVATGIKCEPAVGGTGVLEEHSHNFRVKRAGVASAVGEWAKPVETDTINLGG